MWPGVGPRPRDELAQWSDAPAADIALAPVPGFTEPSPPGRVHLVGGRGVFVRRTAGPSGGPEAWYIHGLAGASGNWDRLAAALSGLATGWAPDLPGSGRSDPPPGGRYPLVGEADLVAALIRTLSPGPVHLAGNSRGGVVATYLAARHPDLVRSLTLISPAVPDLRLVGERGADARLALLMLPGTTAAAERRLAALTPLERARGMAAVCFGEPEALSDADLAAAEQEIAWRSDLPWVHRATIDSLRSLIRAQLMPGRWSFAAAARQVRVPVLVVWGTRDRLVDVRLARRTADAFADSRLLVLPRTGHVAQMERPVETARAVAALWSAADRRLGSDPVPVPAGAPQPVAARPVAT
jgi:pimeloyl-ACP methyl ester carboxylesterase